MRTSLIIIVCVVALGVVGSWMYVQPGKALTAVTTALDRDDPALLAPVMDQAVLRSNLKNREAAKFSGQIPEGGPGGLLGLFGQALAESVIGTLTQSAATPEGVLALLRGAAASAPDPAPGPAADRAATPSQRLFSGARRDIVGFDRYLVTAPLKGDQALRLVFIRQGTAWLLSDLELMRLPRPNL